jgi:hypothetical protein
MEKVVQENFHSIHIHYLCTFNGWLSKVDLVQKEVEGWVQRNNKFLSRWLILI